MKKKATGPILLTDAFYASVVYIVEVLEVLPQRLDLAQNCLWKCSNFDTKNYARRLDIAQNFSFLILFKPLCSKKYIKKIFKTIQLMKIWYSSKLFLSDFFGTFCPRIFFRKYLKQFNSLRRDIVLKSLWNLGSKCSNALISVTTPDQNVAIIFVTNIYIY